MVAIPEEYESLLERPVFGHLATVRPDGRPQVNPMWFDWDGELLRFTHTTKRQKYRNIAANPDVAMSYFSSSTVSELKRYAMRARPFTRPESATSVTTPASDAPVGTTVFPSTTTASRTLALTGSSTLLVSDPRLEARSSRSVVPAGIVTSR